MTTATHEDSDGTGFCRGCGTTIGEDHHEYCDLETIRRQEKSVNDNKVSFDYKTVLGILKDNK